MPIAILLQFFIFSKFEVCHMLLAQLAGQANSITSQKLCICEYVFALTTQVALIITITPR